MKDSVYICSGHSDSMTLGELLSTVAITSLETLNVLNLFLMFT